jgi:hypothetical protein
LNKCLVGRFKKPQGGFSGESGRLEAIHGIGSDRALEKLLGGAGLSLGAQLALPLGLFVF